MKRVTGVGGIFFKAKDAPAWRAWYQRHLGIDVQDWGGAAQRAAAFSLAARCGGRDPSARL